MLYHAWVACNIRSRPQSTKLKRAPNTYSWLQVRYERFFHIHKHEWCVYAMSVSFTYGIMTGTLWAFLSRTEAWLVRYERFSHIGYILMTSRSERFFHIQNHDWYAMSVSFTHRFMTGTLRAFLSHTETWLVRYERFSHTQIHDWYAMSVSFAQRFMTGTLWAFLSHRIMTGTLWAFLSRT